MYKVGRCGCQSPLNPDPNNCSFIPPGNFGKLANEHLLCGIFRAKATVCNREMWNSIWVLDLIWKWAYSGKEKKQFGLGKGLTTRMVLKYLVAQASKCYTHLFFEGFLTRAKFQEFDEVCEFCKVMGKHFFKHFLFDNLSGSFFISSDNLETL